MSLETIIQENTAAIRELIAAIGKGVPTTAAQVAAVVQEAKPEVKKEKPKAEKTAPAEEVKAEVVEPAAEVEKVVEEFQPAEAPTYQDTAAVITKLAQTKGREAAVTLLSTFGAGKLPEVKPEDFAAVIAAATEALGA